MLEAAEEDGVLEGAEDAGLLEATGLLEAAGLLETTGVLGTGALEDTGSGTEGSGISEEGSSEEGISMLDGSSDEASAEESMSVTISELGRIAEGVLLDGAGAKKKIQTKTTTASSRATAAIHRKTNFLSIFSSIL